MSRLINAIGKSKILHNVLSKMPFVKSIGRRFVPGEEVGDLEEVLIYLINEKFNAVLAPLPDANHSAEFLYHEVISFLEKKSYSGSLAIRPPINDLDSLVKHAKSVNVPIEVDMQSSNLTDATIGTYCDIHKQYANTTICLQSYLKRTWYDLSGLLKLQPKIRLVKGAFYEKEPMAYSAKKEVDDAYIKIARHILLNSNSDLIIATHDRKMINWIISFMDNFPIPKQRIAFQFMYGITPWLHTQLKSEGYEVSLYIPYGREWFPYMVNRIFERKENFLFAVKQVMNL